MKIGNGRMLLSGNHAASYGAVLARPKVIPIYPITPQTPISEKLTELKAEGAIEAEFITPESEHSSMSACITASLCGVRVFTATASQGLLLMHELLHYAVGARAPIVMVNVNRTVASPWGFWPDQTDSLAQRDTGWIQYYSESAQETLDTIIQAYKTSEKVLLPAFINHDAFYVSHSLEVVQVPSQALVDSYLPPFEPENILDPDRGKSWGNVVSQKLYWQHRKNIGDAMDQAITVAKENDQEWEAITGRGYGLFEKYRCEKAEILVVAMGSMAGNARAAIDILRSSGIAAGLLKVKLFRPFPVEEIRSEIAGIPRLVVLDRNFSPGIGGIPYQELKASLYGMEKCPSIFGYLTGVGGLNVSPVKIEDLVKRSREYLPSVNSIWVR